MERQKKISANHVTESPTQPKANPSAPVVYTPEQEELRLQGLRILARMIVKAYLRDQDQGHTQT